MIVCVRSKKTCRSTRTTPPPPSPPPPPHHPPSLFLTLHPLPIQLFSKNMQPHRLKPIPRINPRPPPMRRPPHQPIPIFKIFAITHTEHYANKIRPASMTPRRFSLLRSKKKIRPCQVELHLIPIRNESLIGPDDFH